MTIGQDKLPTKLVSWYRKHHRRLPWRKCKDPFGIWISEIMLQQTRVETVINYYHDFMKRFPTVQDLAKASLDDVLKQWEGLGYYYRARNIYKTARLIIEKHKGKFPKTYEDTLSLPGIGAYTAGAILSIAYNQCYPAVDGNVLRVISRVFLIQKDIGHAHTKAKISHIVKALIPTGKASDFNQALMELGAVICLPEHPKCLLCPIRTLCRAFKYEKQDYLPIKTRKTKQRVVHRFVGVIKKGKKVLMRRRPENGLLAGLWEFPGVEAKTKREFRNGFFLDYGLHVEPIQFIMDSEHVFTHIHWKMKVFECKINGHANNKGLGEMRWISKSDLSRVAIPVAFQKIKDHVFRV